MIPDYQTNFLYLADTLPRKYPAFYARFEKVLNHCGIHFQLLPGTKDVWAVDYMPVQLRQDRFVKFVYNPSYLQSKKQLKTISDVDAICGQTGFEPLRSSVVLDGGNVTKSRTKVIMTERIFSDNPQYDRQALLKELQGLFEVEDIFILPQQPHDFTGHADGMIRFVDEQTVLVNDYQKEEKLFIKEFEEAIKKTGLDVIRIPYNPYHNKSYTQDNGDYINFLLMENAVIIPTFGIAEDEIVMRKFEQIFKGKTIATVEANELANDGGILNCISWNILK